MNKTLTASVIFLFSSSVIAILLYFNSSYHTLQLIVLLLLMVILVLVEYQIRKDVKDPTSNTEKIYLLLFTFFTEVLVVSTGGVGSHFLLIASLFTLAISFLINTLSALIFLMFFFSLLGFQVYHDQNVQSILISDPAVLLLMVLTFVIVGCLATILNEYYHLKDVFVEVLKKKLSQREFHEQTILSNLTELIIITDLDLNIVSANEAVEKVVMQAKSELLNKNLFSVLSLKIKKDIFLTKNEISSANILNNSLQLDHITLVTAGVKNEEGYNLTVKPVLDLEGKLYQLIFILRRADGETSTWQEDTNVLDQAITKQQAMIEDIRVQLVERGIKDLVFKAALIGKLDREVRSLIDLKSNSINRTETSVDVIRVVKNTCDVMRSFADKVHVRIYFTVDGSDNKTKNVRDEDGLYAQIDLLWFDVLLHKLMEMAILLSSSSEEMTVMVTVQQSGESITVVIKSSYTKLDANDREALFAPNFGDLSSSTNLKLASGLEGYIARQISEKIALPIDVEILPQGTVFILQMHTTRGKLGIDS